MKRLITFILITTVITLGLYFLIPTTITGPTPEVVEEIKETISMRWNFQTCMLVGILFALLNLIYSFKRKQLDESELEKEKLNMIFWKLPEEIRKNVKLLSDSEKEEYLKNVYNSYTKGEKFQFDDEFFDRKKSLRKSNYGFIKFILLISVFGYFGSHVYYSYKDAYKIVDAYETELEEYYNSPYEDTIYIEGLPVIEVSGNNRLKEQLEPYIKMLKKQPLFLMNNCKLIRLSNKKITIDGEEYAAYANSDGMVVTDRILPDEDLNKDHHFKNHSGTMTHELTHIYDFTIDNGGYGNYGSSNSQYIINIYNENPNSITEYGAKNVHEFFAEAGEMYIHNPKELQKKNVKMYEYFDKYYGPNL